MTTVLTIVPGNGTFKDAAGTVYSIDTKANALANGRAMRNGGNTAALSFFNNTVYALGTSGAWRTWNGNGWTAGSAPGSTPAPTTPTPAPTVPTPAPTVPTPVPTPPASGPVTRDTIMNWLTTKVQGKGTIVVQQIMGQSNDISSINNVHNQSGQWVSAIGGNYYNNDGEVGPSNTSWAAIGTQCNSVLIDWWNKGGLAFLSGFMWPSPATAGGGPADTGAGQAINQNDLVTPGTATYNNWHKTLDDVAAGIQELARAGVVVFFRPLHEYTGNWFWWGTTWIDDQHYVTLWQQMHDYLCNTKGLKNNIIWILGGCSGGDRPARYPGDAYVDIVGFDNYENDPRGDIQNMYNMMAHYNKPIGFCEWGSDNGAVVDETNVVNAMKMVPNCLYWEQWSGTWSIDKMSNVNAAMNDPWVLTRDRLNRPTTGGGTSTATPSPTATGSVSRVTPGNGSFKDAAGNTYSIDGSKNAMENGKAMNSGANTGAMELYNNTVYGQDASTGLWWIWNGSGWTQASAAPPSA